MTFRNPWIDPRIVQVQPEDAKAYLRRRGWKSLGTALNPLLETFEGPAHGPETATVLVPLALDEGPLLQRMIDLVSDLARPEDRWTAAVVSGLLQEASAQPVPAKGPGAREKSEPAAR